MFSVCEKISLEIDELVVSQRSYKRFMKVRRAKDKTEELRDQIKDAVSRVIVSLHLIS